MQGAYLTHILPACLPRSNKSPRHDERERKRSSPWNPSEARLRSCPGHDELFFLCVPTFAFLCIVIELGGREYVMGIVGIKAAL